MLLRRFALTLLGALALGTPTGGEEVPIATVVERVTTARDADQSYALYLPSGYGSSDRLWPVLIVLDPRGRAVAGVERFRQAAERHGYVVLSSHQSRSDTLREVNVKALDALLIEVQARYRVDPRRFYLAGMSGTAHAAWRFAQFLEPQVAGVIAAAGGVQESSQGPPGDATFAYYGITSTADFNYREVMRLEEHMLENGIDHRIAVFEGRHGWPPHELTNRALGWMELQAMKRGLRERDPELIASELDSAREAVGTAVDPLERLRRLRDVVRDFAELGADEADRERVRRLEEDPAIDKRRNQERKLARDEHAHLTQRYAPWLRDLLSSERRPPTVRESLLALRIGPLRKQAADSEDLPRAHSAQRILESVYVGVAFYQPRELEKSGRLDQAIRSFEVAVEIFPERAPAHWRLASLLVQSERLDAGLESLRTAIGFGGVDLERLKADPVWEPLRARPEWATVLAEAEKKARR